MTLGIEMPGEADQGAFASLPRRYKRLHCPTRRKDPVNVAWVHDVVHLPEVDMVGFQ